MQTVGIFTFDFSSSSPPYVRSPFTRHCCQYSDLSIPEGVVHFSSSMFLFRSVVRWNSVCSDINERAEALWSRTLILPAVCALMHWLCLHLTPPLSVYVVRATYHFRIDSLGKTRPPRASRPSAISLATRCLSNRREAAMCSWLVLSPINKIMLQCNRACLFQNQRQIFLMQKINSLSSNNIGYVAQTLLPVDVRKAPITVE